MPDAGILADGILPPGSTIGILGAGQLGRMLALAAARLGLRTHVFAHDRDEPAAQVATVTTLGAWDDTDALARFAAGVDVITYEFENVPLAAVEALAARKPVRPGALALAKTQDRLAEKTFLNEIGVETAPFTAVADAGALARVIGQIGRPAILKTRRFGYDGKGQILLREGSDVGAAFRTLRGAPAILEGVVPFTREVSVIAARGLDGTFRAFDLCENEHVNHILAVTRVPAAITAETAAQATAIARRIADALDYVGVLAVEMFVVVRDGREAVIVNEIAPRVHNSGHWTLDGAVISQFEQHIRAICGWPLGSSRRHGRVEMRNLIGDEATDWRALAASDGASVHLYGKAESRAGRKMGHVTRILPE